MGTLKYCAGVQISSGLFCVLTSHITCQGAFLYARPRTYSACMWINIDPHAARRDQREESWTVTEDEHIGSGVSLTHCYDSTSLSPIYMDEAVQLSPILG